MRDGDTGVEAGGAQLDFSELGPNPTSANSRFPPWIPHPFVPWGLSLRSADPKGRTVPWGGELRALLIWSHISCIDYQGSPHFIVLKNIASAAI